MEYESPQLPLLGLFEANFHIIAPTTTSVI